MKTLDYRNFVSFLESDDDLKGFAFVKMAFLLKQDAKNCCKCQRAEKVHAFKHWVGEVRNSLLQEEKNLILEKIGENFIVDMDGNNILEV